MSIEKTEIKNERPGIMLTPGLPASPVAASQAVEDEATEQDRARTHA